MNNTRADYQSREAPTIVIESLGGSCPVQATGTIDGEPFYFRSRGEDWAIEIGPGNTNLVVGSSIGGNSVEEMDRIEALGCWRHEEEYGDWPSAGYISDDEARAFIARGADLWRASKAAV